MSQGPPSLERKSVDSVFKYLKEQLTHRHSSSSTRKSFAANKLVFLKPKGKGSFGSVWKASYLEDNVAVKILRPRDEEENGFSTSSRNLEEEIMKEASVIEQKRSKHIVNLFHYCSNRKMLVMEYCKHGSLYDVMHDPSKRSIVLEWKNRLNWMKCVALGMNLLHNERPSVLHRDLKPSNILLTKHFDAKVADFGLALQLLTDFDTRCSDSTHDLRVIWQPPEVMEERRYSTKSDVYSFGVIMQQVLTLDGPHGFSSSTSYIDLKVHSHVTGGKGLQVPEDRSMLPGKWHPCLEKYIDLMNRCCATKPEDRPDFDEISKTLVQIEKEYKKARMAEAFKEQCSAESLRRIFLGAALGAFCVSSISHLMNYGGINMSPETSTLDGNHSFVAVFFSLTGLILVSASTLCVGLEHRETFSKSLKKQVVKDETSPTRSLSELIDEYNRLHEDPNLSRRSPFALGPSPQWPAALGSDSTAVYLEIPDPEIWKEIRAAFISELEGTGDIGLQAVCRFCQEHNNEQLVQHEWEDFVRLLSRESEVSSTDAWRRYQTHLTVPSFYTEGVLSSQDSITPVDNELVSVSSMSHVSGSKYEESLSALQSNEFSFPRLARSASFSFDRGGQLESEQRSESELFPKSFSLEMPTTTNEAFEKKNEADSRCITFAESQVCIDSPQNDGE